MIVYNSQQKFFYSTLINDNHHFAGFSTRDLGDASDLKNIKKFFLRQNYIPDKLIVLEQVHSVNIEVFDSITKQGELEILRETDGVITWNFDTALIVRNADCVPIVYCDKRKGLIGISHQGWRGSLKNMATKMLSTFLSLKSKVENLKCAIGPSIGACCYDVDDDRYYDFLQEYDGYSDKIFSRKENRWQLNLALLNYLQLIDAGVKKENIDFFPFCTKCDNKRFFSYRRSKRKKLEKMFNFVMKI